MDKAAAAAGYLVPGRKELELLPQSQLSLLVTRSALWVHIIILLGMGWAVSHFSGYGVFRHWLKNLSFKEKLITLGRIPSRLRRKICLDTDSIPRGLPRGSSFGTAKRVYVKNLIRPCNVGERESERRCE